MCGIFGYIGKKDPLKECLKGLKKLEYRGYDSSGIAGFKKNNIIVCKEVGKIHSLEKKIELKELSLSSVIIGHTRWATHGKANEKNAHPHTDEKKILALVHNGIIENFDSIKNFLINKNFAFSTDTDSEVIAQLISYHYKKDILLALHESMKMLKGSFALALLHKNHKNQILAASRESPIAIGFSDEKEEILLSSDPNAFLGRNLNVFYLKNNEVALINNEREISVYNNKKKKISKKIHFLEGINKAPSKEGFEHYMLKEIYEQPITIQKAMLEHFSEDFGTAYFEGLKFSPTELTAVRHILIIACGTSWHAGCIGASMLEDKARIPTHAEIASEVRFKNPIISDDTLVIAISQSGETADTIAAIREVKAKGAKVLGICNVKNSTLTRESHSCIFLKAGPEMSVCSTKAFTSQITILSLFALFMARLRHLSKEEGQKFLKELKKIPKIVKGVINRADEIKELAEKYSKYKHFFYLGRRYMYVTSLEAALKLKEISYLNANAYPAGEMKHGPIALIDNNLPVIAFCSNRQTYDKMINNLMTIKAREAPILALAPNSSSEIEKIVKDVFYLPERPHRFWTTLRVLHR
jgi:glucosamine--fructose-6-phosphate aminotransferase (isomerizing)